MDRSQAEQQVARISVIAKLEFLPAVLSFTREMLLKLGLDTADAEHMELVVEEACVNVIEYAFDPGERGSYEVEILRRPGQIVVAVQDQGLPFDFKKYEGEQKSSLGVILMKAFADEVRFINLGRNGKRVELIKNLPYRDIAAYVSEDGTQTPGSLPPVPDDSQITVRPTRPEDSVNLARCVYRCYGYSYPSNYIFYPDKLRELLQSGLLLSYIALNPDNEVIGHIALCKNDACARVGEGGQAVVDPRYRGHGFLGKMVLSFAEYLQANGIYGAFSEAVTIHPYSQKASLAMGGYETGVLLGYIPANILFKQMGGEQQQRQTVVLLYTSFNGEPPRDVYPPLQHEAIIREIYAMGKLQRNIITGPGFKPGPEVPAASEVNLKVQAEVGQAFMQVTKFGADLAELVKFRLKELCIQRIDCIYVDLPLADPAARSCVAPLEMLGFFFAGIIPELSNGDVLRLQYLNNVDVDTGAIQTASDFGKRLVEYVTKARERT